MQKPILLGVEGEVRANVERYNVGLYFEPENTEAFKQALLRVRNEAELRATVSSGGYVLATAYDRRKLAKKMLDRIAILTGTR